MVVTRCYRLSYSNHIKEFVTTETTEEEKEERKEQEG